TSWGKKFRPGLRKSAGMVSQHFRPEGGLEGLFQLRTYRQRRERLPGFLAHNFLIRLMKVLVDHSWPFSLAHGGVQKQIEESKAALQAVGLEVEYLRWWDSRQEGDLIHFFCAPSAAYLRQARLCQLPVVATVFFSEACNRPDWKLKIQGLATHLILAQPFASGIKEQLTWIAYRRAPRLVVGLQAERSV